MNDKVFFDTNIILYLYSEDEEWKLLTSHKMMNICEQPTISTQVVNELINGGTNGELIKYKPN